MVVISITNLPAIGEAIKNRRKSLAMSQGELCERTGISQTYLSLIESGKKVPMIPKLLHILSLLELELQVLEAGDKVLSKSNIEILKKAIQ